MKDHYGTSLPILGLLAKSVLNSKIAIEIQSLVAILTEVSIINKLPGDVPAHISSPTSKMEVTDSPSGSFAAFPNNNCVKKY